VFVAVMAALALALLKARRRAEPDVSEAGEGRARRLVIGGLAATLLILVALAGVGLATDVRSLVRVGPRPFLLAGALWVVVGTLGLLLARVYHGG
jgi:uncharacterized membrane protein YadS